MTGMYQNTRRKRIGVALTTFKVRVLSIIRRATELTTLEMNGL